jgi:hypothetical protein
MARDSKINRRQLLIGTTGIAATIGVGSAAVLPPARFGDVCDCHIPERNNYLLLDSRLIAKTDNVELRLGDAKKHPENPLFGEDRPWEPYFDNAYPNVLYDEQEKLFKCWYMPFIISEAHARTPRGQRKYGTLEKLCTTIEQSTGRSPLEEGICYATSPDGIHWEKPDLGLIEFDGNKRNNIVARQFHGPKIIKELREPDPERRYKMFFHDQTGVRNGSKGRGHSVAFSKDGLQWGAAIQCPHIGGVYDGAHSAFWTPQLRKYVGFMRMFTHGRAIGRTESDDFQNWTESRLVLHGRDYVETPAEKEYSGSLCFRKQTYSMPVFPFGDVYLGLPAIYDIELDVVQTELAWSPDSIQWHRICPGTPVIAPSQRDVEAPFRVPKDSKSYDWGCIYAADAPVVMANEIRLYYNGSNGLHFDWRDGFFCLATLPPDGFAGYVPINLGRLGTVLTVPLLCTGSNLQVRMDSDSELLEIKVFGDGPPSLGHASGQSSGIVQWTNGGSLARYQGKRVQVEFTLKTAKLYSLRFGAD